MGCLQWDQLEPFGCETWYFYNTTGNEMPSDGEQEERVTKIQTMRRGVTCSTTTDAMNSGHTTSAGAVTGYVFLALILCVLLVAAVVVIRRKRKERRFSFAEQQDDVGLSKQATGGISAASMGTIELENAQSGDGNAATGQWATIDGNAQPVPADSMTMSLDGDGNVTGTQM